MRDLCEAVTELRSRQNAVRHLARIGIGSPGPLELPSGILRNPPGWDGFGLRYAIESALNEPVEIECDANLGAFAEQKLGFVAWPAYANFSYASTRKKEPKLLSGF